GDLPAIEQRRYLVDALVVFGELLLRCLPSPTEEQLVIGVVLALLEALHFGVPRRRALANSRVYQAGAKCFLLFGESGIEASRSKIKQALFGRLVADGEIARELLPERAGEVVSEGCEVQARGVLLALDGLLVLGKLGRAGERRDFVCLVRIGVEHRLSARLVDGGPAVRRDLVDVPE